MTANLSAEVRAVVRAFDGLTTQVRRIADALPTPVVDDADATQTPPTTAADDARNIVHAVDTPAPVTVHIHGQQPLTGTFHGGGTGTPRGSAEMVWEPTITFPRKRPPMDPVHILGVGAPAADAPTTPATTCSAQYTGTHPTRWCIRAAHHTGKDHVDEAGFHWADTVAVYPTDSTVRIAHWHPASEDDPALPNQAAEDVALRWDRRESLGVLLSRAERGVLKPQEAALLRTHVETEIRESNETREVSARNLQEARMMFDEVQTVLRDRDQARAALAQMRTDTQTADRIRAEAQRDRDQHAAVLAEVLRGFRQVDNHGVTDEGAVLGFVGPTVTPEDYHRWCDVVAPTVERPWWVDVAEIRTELTEAQAAIERVREFAEYTRDKTSTGRNDHEIGQYETAVQALALLGAVEGGEQPEESS